MNGGEEVLECLVILENNDEEIAAASLRLMARLQRFPGRSEVRIAGMVFGDASISQYLEGGEFIGKADTSPYLEICSDYGLDKLYQVGGLVTTDPRTWISAIVEIVRKEQIALVILPGTPNGHELAANLTVQLDAGVVADCQEISFNEGGLEAVVEVYNRQYQMITSLAGNQNIVMMADIDPGMVEPTAGKECAFSRIIVPTAGKPAVEILETFYLPAGELDIAEADTIVGIGRGVETRADLELVQELATVIDAAIAGTRPAVDAGHIQFIRQIGQTGRIVAPQLYFAMGISGAPQHITGVIDAKIVAINNDPKAPILRLADLGVVGDLREIVPRLVNRLKEINQMNAQQEIAGRKVEGSGDE